MRSGWWRVLRHLCTQKGGSMRLDVFSAIASSHKVARHVPVFTTVEMFCLKQQNRLFRPAGTLKQVKRRLPVGQIKAVNRRQIAWG